MMVSERNKKQRKRRIPLMLRRRCTWCTWCVRYIPSVRESEHLGRRDDVQLERCLTELSTGTVCVKFVFSSFHILMIVRVEVVADSLRRRTRTNKRRYVQSCGVQALENMVLMLVLIESGGEWSKK